MTKKLGIFLLLTLSMVSIGGTTLESYYDLEKEINNITKYNSNGVRLEYVSNNSLKEEKDLLREVYSKDYKIKEEKNSLILEGKFKIEINLNSEKNKTYISLTVINNKEENSTLGIKKELQKSIHKESENIKIFQFYKGEVLKKQEEKILDELKQNKIEVLKIENGYTGKIKLGKDTVNFGLINYDTGSHLIIGTPIIFTTY